MAKHIVIIGGGVTGLSAAYCLRRAQRAGADICFTLLERNHRLGGKVAGETVLDPETGEPYIVDGGPDCFSAYKPGGRRAARLLGLENDWLPSNEVRKKVYLYRSDRTSCDMRSRQSHLHELPQGFSMFVPTELTPLLETELISEEAKQAMARELSQPVRDWSGRTASGTGDARRDETLESFVTRRFDREVLDYLAEPFIGGVHASDPKDMSLAATFPLYFDLEAKYGSVIKGTVLSKAARRQAAANRPKDPDDIWGNTVFATFRNGMHELVDALVAEVGECVQTGIYVIGITRTSDGRYLLRIRENSTFALHSVSGSAKVGAMASSPVVEQGSDCGRSESVPTSSCQQELLADAVIIATESYAGARLTAELDTELSQAYAGIPNLSSATTSFAFRASDLGEDRYDGFGVLVPEVEKRNLLAATWSSTKWRGRAPEGRVLIRGFAGTPQNQAVMELPDEELTAIVLDELREILQLPRSAEPLFSRLYRWTLGMSQYTMGHLDRVEAIEKRVAATKGLACAGGCFRGVGIPNCLDGGEDGARKVLFDLGVVFDEMKEGN